MKLSAVIGAVVAISLTAAGATGKEQQPVKIGVLTDMTSIYSQDGGPGSVEAAHMAVEDFGGSVLGKPIEILFADDRNDTGLGVSIARRWYAEGVDAITDVANSAVALAVEQVSREAKRIVLFSSPASADLTGPYCSPYAVDWTYNTYALAAERHRSSCLPTRSSLINTDCMWQRSRMTPSIWKGLPLPVNLAGRLKC